MIEVNLDICILFIIKHNYFACKNFTVIIGGYPCGFGAQNNLKYFQHFRGSQKPNFQRISNDNE